VAQEALKFIQKKHRPILNLMVYCPEDGAAKVFHLGDKSARKQNSQQITHVID
jgi:hypothetical protein